MLSGMRNPPLLRCILTAFCVLAANAASPGAFAADVSESATFGPRFRELATQATPAQLYALLYDMPKGGDLHNHSGGSYRAEWIYSVCTDPARNGADTFYTRVRFAAAPDSIDPTARYRTIRRKAYELLSDRARAEYLPLAALSQEQRREWCDSLRLDGTGDGRVKFFSQIWPRLGQVLGSLPASTELLVETMKAFGAEHLAYLETQFMVDEMVDNEGSVIPPGDAAAYVRRRLAKADAVATGVTVRFQHTILRFAPDAEAHLERAYGFVDSNRDLWVGLNLAGVEENGRGHPLRFLETFRRMRSVYPTLPLSIHAGEMDGPDLHIRDTLLLGASRIGHGVNLIEDPETLLLLQQTRRVLVEVNLISNRLLGYVPDLSKHPFPEYLRTGVPVCLNTDDRGMWDSNMTDEYYTAVTLFHLSWEEVVSMGRNSIAHSFAQPDVKARLLADFNARISAFEQRYGSTSLEQAIGALGSVRPASYGYAKRTWGFDFN
jgi:adenosine deaminase CECR1